MVTTIRGESCNSHAALFYGLYVHSESLIRPIEAFFTLHRQLAVLRILATRRRSGSQVCDLGSAASRIPEEIWHQISSSLISQELDRLEVEDAKVGVRHICAAGNRLQNLLDPSMRELLTCDMQELVPGHGVCAKCRKYLQYGFEIRDNAYEILAALLATYSLYPTDMDLDSLTDYFGIAVHSPLEKYSFQTLSLPGNTYRAMPLSLPNIRESHSRRKVAAFLKDFRVKPNKDPLYEAEVRAEGWEEYKDSSDDDEDERRSKQTLRKKELKQRQRKFSPYAPRWMLFHRVYSNYYAEVDDY